MRIPLALPVDAASSRGNGVTARRWQALLQDLGHSVVLQDSGAAEPCDLLIALHARKSAAAIQASRRAAPGRPVVLAMTGTDLHDDLPGSAEALASVSAADRIVVLYPGAEAHLPLAHRDRVRVILQSAPQPAAGRAEVASVRPADAGLCCCVLAHLREVKDPLCAARAVATLPAGQAVQVTLAGSADARWRQLVEAEAAANQRFSWAGGLEVAAAAQLLADSDALVVSSRAEGGANVVSEAIGLGVPVFASRIDSTVGMLGVDYGGYFPVGDVEALAALMTRAITEPQFLSGLRRQLLARQPLFDPARERQAWGELLDGL